MSSDDINVSEDNAHEGQKEHDESADFSDHNFNYFNICITKF